MLKDKTVAVVVPAYNEESQILRVLETMPNFVDKIVVVNDLSTDKTSNIIADYCKVNIVESSIDFTVKRDQIENNPYNFADMIVRNILEEEEKEFTPGKTIEFPRSKIVLIEHSVNGGVGAAIATGYKWCRDHSIDCTAVMAGDGQMDPNELESICLPVLREEVDYVKGNRLIHKAASVVIPKTRLVGNSVLSMLTKIASGYWHVSDTQTGYTAISLAGLKGIRLHRIYKSYGMPNDILVKLNIGRFKIKEIPIKPVYNIGEQSKMKIWKVIPRVSFLLTKSFFKRLFLKYFLRDFHPLFICYFMFFSTLLIDIPLLSRLIYDYFVRHLVNDNYLMVSVLMTLSSIQFLLFGMWFDMQDNERLHVE